MYINFSLFSCMDRHTHTCVRVGEIKQLHAGVQIGKGADTEAVGWVKLSYEKLAAGLFNFLQLQQTSGRQEHLNTHIHKQKIPHTQPQEFDLLYFYLPRQ